MKCTIIYYSIYLLFVWQSNEVIPPQNGACTDENKTKKRTNRLRQKKTNKQTQTQIKGAIPFSLNIFNSKIKSA